MSARAALALGACAAAALAASFAGAYSFTCGKHPSGFGSFSVNPNFRDAIAGTRAQQIAAIRRAGDEWTNRGGAKFAWAYAGESSLTRTDLGDNVNVIFALNQSSSSTLAYTVCSQTPSRLAFDIVFLDGWSWNDNAADGTGGFDIEGIAAHELGHALGLGHSEVPGSTMWPSALGNGVANRTIEADDIAGIRAIYGVPVAPRKDSIEPAEGKIAGGTNVVILGDGFDSTTRVFFGGVEGEVTAVVPPDELFARTPAGSAMGSVEVELRNRFGGSTFNPACFSYVPNPIEIEIVGGYPGAGQSVTILVTGPQGARWAAATGTVGTPTSRRGIDFCFDIRRAELIGSSLGAGTDPRLDAQGRATMTATIPADAETFSYVYFQGVVAVGGELRPTNCLVLSVFP